eukprot:COSAG01_NODE_40498_length_462_cov_22.743802_2_plen_23_part_01
MFLVLDDVEVQVEGRALGRPDVA